MKVGLAQISPVWLKKEMTIKKIIGSIQEASKESCGLVCFGEALLPGYPFWLAITGGAKWDDKVQKEIFAYYLENSISIEDGDLNEIKKVIKQTGVSCYLGIIERAADRGGHSLYCSLVYFDQSGEIQSVHRKLQPTYDERLVWSPGDGNGLVTHKLNEFTVGGLNCWENWMPLPRTALYAQGEDLHVAVWPGSVRNTEDITRFVAKESRSFVISVSALMRGDQIPSDIPHAGLIKEFAPDEFTDGGSCIAGPDGNWILEPVLREEGLFTAELDIQRVYEERQNFDPSGHYSRPDVTQLKVNRERQSILKF